MNQLQFYKPTPKSTGAASSFWIKPDDKEGMTFWCSLIKQHSWDAKRRTGSFIENKDNKDKRVIIKFSDTEYAGIADAIDRNAEYTGYHGSQNQVVKYRFGPYLKQGEQVGFSLSVQKEDKEDSTNKQRYVIGFYFNEAKLLSLYLETALKQSFTMKRKERS